MGAKLARIHRLAIETAGAIIGVGPIRGDSGARRASVDRFVEARALSDPMESECSSTLLFSRNFATRTRIGFAGNCSRAFSGQTDIGLRREAGPTSPEIALDHVHDFEMSERERQTSHRNPHERGCAGKPDSTFRRPARVELFR
jgi:hypothetical protein